MHFFYYSRTGASAPIFQIQKMVLQWIYKGDLKQKKITKLLGSKHPNQGAWVVEKLLGFIKFYPFNCISGQIKCPDYLR